MTKYSFADVRTRLLSGVSLAVLGAGALAIVNAAGVFKQFEQIDLRAYLAEALVDQQQEVDQENHADVAEEADADTADATNGSEIDQGNYVSQEGIAEATADVLAHAAVDQQQDVDQANDADVDLSAQTGTGDASTDASIDQVNENGQAGTAEAMADELAQAEVDQHQDASQTNDADLVQSAQADTGDAINTTRIDQGNSNYQVGTAEATAGEFAIENTTGVVVGGNAIVASSSAAATIIQHQEVHQTNVADIVQGAQATVGNATNTADVDQANSNSQAGTAGATAGDVAVDNSGDIVAGGDGIAATSSAAATVNQHQVVSQTNDADIVQAAQVDTGSATDTATVEQSSSNSQLATAEAIAGDVAIENSGDIVAGGNGIVASSSAAATIVQNQEVDQTNVAHLVQAGQADVGNATNTTDVAETNSNSQTGTAGATAGDVTIRNTGDIVVGGDGIVATSSAAATLDQHQVAFQTNEADLVLAAQASTGDATDDAEVDQFNSNSQLGVAGATAGDVAIDHAGDIVAGGRGLAAQSVATGRTAVAGTVDLVSSGNIVAGTEGIYAASSANGGLGSDVTVSFGGGTVMGGHGFYGISISGGATNTITNLGTVSSLSNQAMAGGLGDETVHNRGTATGDVDLSGGSNAFFNYEDAWFNTWDLVGLNGGVLTNSGLIAPGGAGALRTTAIDGHFVNTATAQWLVDLDMASGASDHLEISGTANLSGHLVPTLHSLAHSQDFTIATAAGGTSDDGLMVSDTFFASYDLRYPTPHDVVLSATIDMTSTVAGLNQNQQAIGQFLNRAFIDGIPGELSDLYGSLFTISDISSLAAAYDQLSPKVYLHSSYANLFAGLNFSSDLLSCSARSGAYVFIRQEECAWARLSGRELSFDDTSSQTGFDERSIAMSGGFQRQISKDLHLGLGFGGERGELGTATGASSVSDRLHGGVTLKHTVGPWLFAGALSGGYGWHETNRPIALPGLATIAGSEHEAWNITGRVRTAYLMDLDSWYLKPRLDIAFSHIGASGFTETGGAAALTVSRMHENVLIASPALEWGAEFEMGDGVAVRPYASIGVTGFAGGELRVPALFNGAPDVAPFRTATETDRLLGDIGAGIEVLGLGNASLRLDYSGRISRNVTEHSVGAKVKLSF
jgi:uncharacterized protein with beta-barrel porin domain